jgi:hypothetical protein
LEPLASYDPREQLEIEEAFLELLRAATVDGAKKRKAGKKVSWKYDQQHLNAFHRHVGRVYLDPGGVDTDSGASHWVAVAWRALALAWQETHRAEAREAMRDDGFGA